MPNKDNPSLSDVLAGAIDRRLSNLHTAIPGIVDSYNPDTKTVDVTPALKRKLIDTGEEISIQKIEGVPVGYYQTNDFIFSFPLKEGDEVMLIVMERSIDQWLKKGGIVSPNDQRKFDLSDAVAYPTIKPLGTGLPADSDNVLIKHGSSEFKLGQNKVSLGNGTDEVVDLISQLADACAAILINTKIGPQGPINAGTFSQIKSKADSLKL
jgi:hypothetical protein